MLLTIDVLLRVVDGEIEHRGGRRREHPAEVVAHGVALHHGAEPRDARAEHRLRARSLERVEQTHELARRRREVRVEEADDVAPEREPLEHAAADRLALAPVDAELEHAHAAAVTGHERVEHLACSVGGAVVHEEHVDAGIFEEAIDLTHVQPRGLVVAGDRQPHRGASMSRAAGTRSVSLRLRRAGGA
jgi:hypothetical protein